MLYMYRDIKSSPRLLHGLNLNYLPDQAVKKLMGKIIETVPVKSNVTTEGLIQDAAGRWRDEEGRFAEAPTESKKPHTRVMFKGSGPAGKGEMLAFYRRLKLFPFMNIRETYRTYNEDKVGAVKVINLKL